MTTPGPARTRGISLVEMVIALAILGMMATLALGGLRLGVRTWETVGQRVETESHSQIVRAFLRRTLSQAVAVLEPGDQGRSRPLFTGDGESLSLVAPLADHLGLGGLQRLALAVEDMGADDGHRLALTRTLYHPPGGQDGGGAVAGEPERHVLLAGVPQIRFDYLRDSGDGGREWTGRWMDEPKLPLAVRLTVETQDRRPPWPDLIVPLRVTAVSGRP
ncbi:MAG: prepilin-type N-terminal cleavage/methylation domain-containing protein [Alphaproteobacteria bacterium]|nr:prepilin-type N-terminal cleavage/methylation domain-containing protein [Alphaproteobacteria bacterium]